MEKIPIVIDTSLVKFLDYPPPETHKQNCTGIACDIMEYSRFDTVDRLTVEMPMVAELLARQYNIVIQNG